MEAINRPRSIVKAVAVTAITLTVAAFATALGIGMRAVLWEIKLATAEINKATAAMEQARATVTAAEKQAAATIEGAKLSANAIIEAANRGVEAADRRNYGDIRTFDKATVPAVLDPINEHTQLTKQIEILKNEISTNTEYKTERPLTADQVQAKIAELEKAARQRNVVQQYTGANMQGLLTTVFQGFSGAFKQISDSMKAKKANQ